jgi:hypothetical protein
MNGGENMEYLFEISCTNCKENKDANSIAQLEYIMRKHNEDECKFKEIDNSKYYSSYYISIPGIVRYRDEVSSALEELVFLRGQSGDDIISLNSAISILNDLRLELDDMID